MPEVQDEFIIKVKLLTNEVFEFAIDPQVTTVSELKRQIAEKVKVPIERQRLIFGGKQLIDENLVTDYAKDSSSTLHLIAKMGEPQQPQGQQPQSQQQTSSQQGSSVNQSQEGSRTQPGSSAQSNRNDNSAQQNRNQQQPPNPFSQIFSMLGGVGSQQGSSGNGPQPSVSVSFGGPENINSALNGILGSLGVRLPENQSEQRQQQQATTNNQSGSQPGVRTNNPFQTPENISRRQQEHQARREGQQQQASQRREQSAQRNGESFRVSNEPILNLNQTISSLNLPTEPVLDNSHLSLREQTSQYLRRLQHQYMRLIPQLNRSVQLMNEGRVTHMTEVARLLEAINAANNHAISAARRLTNLPGRSGTGNGTANQNSVSRPGAQSQTSENRRESQMQSQSGQSQPRNAEHSQGREIQMESEGPQENHRVDIIIQEDIVIPMNDQAERSGDDEQNQFEGQEQPQQMNLNSIMGSLMGGQGSQSGGGQVNLNTLLGGLTNGTQSGGFNLGGLMSSIMNPQNSNGSRTGENSSGSSGMRPTNNSSQSGNSASEVPQGSHQPSNSSSQQPSNSSAQQPLLNPQLNIGNIANMLFNPPPQSASQSSQNSDASQNNSANRQSQEQSNPLGNIMGMLGSLQQSGGIGELMSASLGQMLEEGSGQTVYSRLLASVVGSDLMACFTTKNLSFLDTRYLDIRENLLQAASIAGSQEDLIRTLTKDLTALMLPTSNLRDPQQCQREVEEINRQAVTEFVALTLSKPHNQKYSERLVAIFKAAFCRSFRKVTQFVSSSADQKQAEEFVFSNLRSNSIQLMEEFIQGLSAMFYCFIERDLRRVYNEFKEEEKRKAEQTSHEAQSEEELLRSIQRHGERDADYLSKFEHTQFYHSKPE